ncbi:hypothetical protein M0804_013881 [Polistes exclamans]|nr:hypothetical protein M0804_013881 [Polistes exclamans]
MGKLRPYSTPLTEVLQPDVLDRVLRGLFPQVERDSAQDVRGVQVDGAAVTLEEMLAAAKKITSGKAPGPDGVPGIVIRAAAVHCGVGLAELFTKCFRTSNFPTAWKRARLVLIEKKQGAQPDLPGSYRPIWVCSHWRNMAFALDAQRLVPFMMVKDIVRECVDSERVGILTSLDISNAFNSLPWETIFRALDRNSVPTYVTNMVRSYLSD